MKLKYQLRGIGIGLLVTTIILTIAHSMRDVSRSEGLPKESTSTGSILAFDKDAINDETGSLEAETQGSSENATTKPTIKPTESATVKPTEKATEATKPAPTQTQTQAPTQVPTTKPTESVTTGEEVTVHIVNVYSASRASEILYNAGVITDKNAFSMYLYKSGYDVKIQEGYYKVKKGDSFENIAKIITRSK